MYRERKSLAFLLVGLSFLSLVMLPPTPSGQSGGNSSTAPIARLPSGSSHHRTARSSSQYDKGQAPLISTVDVRSVLVSGGKSADATASLQPGFTSIHPQGASKPFSAASLAAAAGSSVIVQSGFDGSFQTNSCGCFPPDPIVAAGPNYLVEMVNQLVSVYYKNGTLFRAISLRSFFSPLGSAFSDPKVLYDTSSGRWFASAIDGNYWVVDFAISNSTDPLVWSIYQVTDFALSPIGLADQPIIGLSGDKFVISVNDFMSISGGWVGAHYWIFNKGEMVVGLKLIDYASFGPLSQVESIHPVQISDATTTEYMVSTLGDDVSLTNTTSELLFTVTGTPPGPVSVVNTTLPIATLLHPILGIQKGGGLYLQIATGDQRVLDTAWYNGKIWSTSADACLPSGDSQQRSCFRLTEIDTATNTLIQDFDVGASGFSYYYPALRVSSMGSLNVVFGYSSANDYPSIAITGQAAKDATGTLSPVVVVKQGTATDSTGGYRGGPRYGDYFGASVDPSDPNLVWVAGQYVSTTGGIWSTFIASMKTVAFTIYDIPTYANIAPGSTTGSAITLRSLGGFSGTASLTATSSPPGLTVSLNPTSLNIPSGGGINSILTVGTSTSTPTGLYNVTVTAASGSMSYSTVFMVRIGPDFQLSSSPSALTLQAGSTANTVATVSLRSLNGFAGVLNITVTSLPFGPSGSAAPVPVSISANGTGRSFLSITAPLQAGAYSLNIYATGSVSHTLTLLLNVIDFGISSPTVSLQAGFSKTSPVTVASLNGYSGNLTISASTSQTGSSASISPSTVTLAAFGYRNATLTASTAGTLPAGNYTVTLRASNGVVSRTGSTLLEVIGFALQGSVTLAVPGGSSLSTNIAVTSVNGFAGNVNLSLGISPTSPGITVSLSPTLVSVNSGSSVAATLAVTTTSGAPRALFVVTATGTSTQLVQNLPMTLAVTPLVLSVNSPYSFTGVNVTTTGSVSIDSPATAFTASGSMSVTAKNGTTGNLLFSKTYAISHLLARGGSVAGSAKWAFLLNIPLSLRLSSNVVLTATGNTTTATDRVTRNLDINGDGIVNGPDIEIARKSYQCFIGQSCYNPAADVNADGRVNIGDFVIISQAWLETDYIPNYNITSSISALTLFPGSGGQATLTLASVNGFSGTVNLNTTVSAAGPSISFSPPSVFLSSGGTAASVLSVLSGSASLGTYLINVTAVSGPIVQFTLLTVKVVDFTIAANPTQITFINGRPAHSTSTITLTSLGPFEGTITLSITVSPSTGISAGILPTMVTLTTGATGYAQLTVSAPTTYNAWSVTITGTFQGHQHSVIVDVQNCSSPQCPQ